MLNQVTTAGARDRIILVILLSTALAALAFLALVPSNGVEAATLVVPTDHSTIQGAVDHASPGDVVRVLQGIYQESVVIPEDLVGLTLEGAGTANTKVTSGFARILVVNADYVTVCGIQFAGNGLNVGIVLYKVDSCTLRNVIVRGCSNGVNLSASSNCLIDGCSISYNKGTGIYLAGDVSNHNIVKSSDIEANTHGVVLNSTTTGCWDNTFIANTFERNTGYGVWTKDRAGPNDFYHNNFLGSGRHVHTPNPYDIFDDNQLGNYWGDYEQRYPGADPSGQVWSIPYQVEASTSAFDRYPLTFRWDPRPLELELHRPSRVTVGTSMTVLSYFSAVVGEVTGFAWTLLPDQGASGVSTTIDQLSLTPRNLGVLNISFEMTDIYGNQAMARVEVEVVDDVPPEVYAGLDVEVNIGATITLDGTASHDNHMVAKIYWVVDPRGLNLVFDGAIATVRMEAVGDFTATLHLTDASGNEAFDSLTIHVHDREPPMANAGEDLLLDQGDTATFDGTMSRDNVGIVDYQWALIYDGKSRYLSGSEPSFTFEVPGTYTVILTVRDAARLSNQAQIKVTVRDSTPPVAEAGEDVLVGQGTMVHFDGWNSSDNSRVISYEWSFAGGGVLKGETTKYTFHDPGVYLVSLIVRDAAGNWASDTMTVTVVDTEEPIAMAADIGTFLQGEVVTFDASGSTDNVGIVKHRWSFFVDGRGHNLTGMYATFSFEEPGEHIIKLTVTDAAGNTASDTFAVTIEYVETNGVEGDGLGWLYGLVVVSVAGVAVVALVSRRLYDRLRGNNGAV